MMVKGRYLVEVRVNGYSNPTGNVAMLKMDVKLVHLESSTAVIVFKLHAMMGIGVTVTSYIA